MRPSLTSDNDNFSVRDNDSDNDKARDSQTEDMVSWSKIVS